MLQTTELYLMIFTKRDRKDPVTFSEVCWAFKHSIFRILRIGGQKEKKNNIAVFGVEEGQTNSKEKKNDLGTFEKYCMKSVNQI